jgi:hypothetical protein
MQKFSTGAEAHLDGDGHRRRGGAEAPGRSGDIHVELPVGDVLPGE